MEKSRSPGWCEPMNKVRCPICDAAMPGNWQDYPDYPFCSKRCKLVDLGKWLGEEHAISEPLRPEHFKDYEELPPGKEPDQPGRRGPCDPSPEELPSRGG